MSYDIDFLVTDINGDPVTGLTSLEFDIIAQVGGIDISTQCTVTESVSANGYYTVTIDPLPIGQGTIQLKYLGVGYGGYPYFVSPDFEYLRKESSYTNDELYGLLYSSTVVPTTIDTASRYATISLNVKEGDDFVETLQVPTRYLPLTGWTDFTAQVYDETRLTDPAALPLGTGLVTVIDDTTGIIEVDISRALTEFTVPIGVGEVLLYTDIQGFDTNTKLRTLIEITWRVRRDFNQEDQVGYGP